MKRFMLSNGESGPLDYRKITLLFVTPALALGALAGTAAWWRHWPVALLWMLACFGLGYLLGFLFGIPSASILEPRPGDEPRTGRGYRLEINNNLIKISDWLTTMLVGVGLVELHNLADVLPRAGAFIATGLGEGASASGAAALILYFGALGFLSGYLSTRMFFGPAFREFDELTVGALRQAAEQPAEQDESSGRPELPALGRAAQAEVRQLRDLSLEQAEARGVPPSAYARAKLELKDFPAALDAYRQAIKADPKDPRKRLEFALALERAGQPRAEILEQLEAAYARLRSTPDPNLRASILFALGYHWLYETDRQPQSFEKAVAAGKQFLENPGRFRTAPAHVNLACAYGQKAAWRIRQNPERRDEVVKELGDEALRHLEAAVAEDPRWRGRIRELLAPPPDSIDDDLAVFASDPRFRELAGIEETPPESSQ